MPSLQRRANRWFGRQRESEDPALVRTILITGASSGMGAALAREYASTGIRLLLCGRNRERLDQVAADCAQRGAEAHIAAFDIADQAAVQSFVDEFAARFSLDLAILAAGVALVATDNKIEDRAAADHVFAVNWSGTLNTVYAVLPHMERNGSGHIVLMSSIGSHYGFMQAPTYCASKAAIRIYGQGLRARLAPQGIAVTVVLPGFVRTPMLPNLTKSGLRVIGAEKGARIIRRALKQKRTTCYFPVHLLAGVLVLRALPSSWQDYLVRSISLRRAMQGSKQAETEHTVNTP